MLSSTSIVDLLNLPILTFYEVVMSIRAVLEARQRK